MKMLPVMPTRPAYPSNRKPLLRRRTSIERQPQPARFQPDDISSKQIIGKGYRGIVLSAVHKPTNTDLALKVINSFEKRLINEYLLEVETLYRSDCPCVVNFHGAFSHEDYVFIAMEHMDGGSLANVIKQLGSVPEKVLASIIYQVAYALAHLQSEGRIHRDIKPTSVLINSSGAVKVSDFAVSRHLQGSELCDSFVGTVQYMSPERIEGHSYGFASDIWGLGLVLYQCATGKLPFSTPADMSISGWVDALKCNNPKPLPTADRNGNPFSREMKDILASCLQSNPIFRPSAESLLKHPWFRNNGAVSVETARANVRYWIHQ